MSGPRIIPEPIAQLPWRVILLVMAIGCFGLVVLYSAAGGSLTPWAKPQGVRFFVLLAGSLVLSRLPLDLWRRIAIPGYLIWWSRWCWWNCSARCAGAASDGWTSGLSGSSRPN